MEVAAFEVGSQQVDMHASQEIAKVDVSAGSRGLAAAVVEEGGIASASPVGGSQKLIVFDMDV